MPSRALAPPARLPACALPGCTCSAGLYPVELQAPPDTHDFIRESSRAPPDAQGYVREGSRAPSNTQGYMRQGNRVTSELRGYLHAGGRPVHTYSEVYGHPRRGSHAPPDRTFAERPQVAPQGYWVPDPRFVQYANPSQMGYLPPPSARGYRDAAPLLDPHGYPDESVEYYEDEDDRE